MRQLFKALILVPVSVVLGACGSPLEELYPVERYSFAQDGRIYDVRAQWDPFERGWFTQTALLYGKLMPSDRQAVFKLVEGTLGPKLCDGARLTVEPEQVWSGQGQTTIRYLPEHGTWHLVGECAG